MLIVGMDIGKHKTKVKWKGGEYGHLSKIATYREIKDHVELDHNNIILEFEERKYLVGDIAEREGEHFLNQPNINKTNLITLLNLLVALSRLPDETFSIVVGNPFSINTQKEREELKSLLYGVKSYKINGNYKRIFIKECGIAPECVAAYYSQPIDDCNILDFGSSTIHAIAIRNKKLVDRRSHTFWRESARYV